MDKREVKIDYTVYENSWPLEYDEVCRKALEIVDHAYSVYSGFSVGAALCLTNGEIVWGTNQENAAYPSGMCAERTALYYAGSRFPGIGIQALAVAACEKGKPTENFVPPCGACRQVMSEYIRRFGDFDVIMMGARQSVCVKASGLIPFAFTLL